MKNRNLFKSFLPLLFAVCMFQTNLQAQNWQLISADKTYNYSNNADGYITHQLWVDSLVTVTTGDMLYLNRIAGVCDTCDGLLEYYAGKYYTNNHPQFLMKKAVQNESYFWMQDSASMVIYPHSNLNDTWLFDSTHNLTAEVYALSEESIFGQMDSVKTIVVDGREIQISKSFGILEFPDYATENNSYQLIGIESESEFFGYQRPCLLDFFDMEIGEGKKYKTSYGSPGGSDYNHIPLKLIERNLTNDSLELVYENTMDLSIEREVIYLNQAHPATAPLNCYFPFASGHSYLSDAEEVFYSMTNTRQISSTTWTPDTTLSMEFGVCFGYGTSNFGESNDYPYADKNYDSINQVFYNSALAEFKNTDDYSFSNQFFGETYGMVHREYFKFEAHFTKYIYDYIEADGDWVLTIDDDTNEVENQIYPNPTSDKLYISNLSEGTAYEIFDSYGRKVITGNYQEKINLSGLTSGMYFIRYETVGKVERQAFVVMER